MDPKALVDTVRGYGAHLTVTPQEKLRVHNHSRLPDELLTLLSEYRDAVIQVLRPVGVERIGYKTPQTPQNSEKNVLKEENSAGFCKNNPVIQSQNPAGTEIETPQIPARKCGNCANWQTEAYGDGLCIWGRAAHGWLDGNPQEPVITTINHQCGVDEGRGWKPKP